ncbi:MAG: glycoside hydrolase [Desulfatitalea sp. BRH_c12]|nr:MAG: glycoside hydrolase [Desulfatitalea sp. BRH_c12]
MTNRYVCIHGHFYQPPRENAWLEAIEIQDSAYPYHDWNERITAECYAANAASRILDAQQHILELVSNYSKISFNFGPTLLAWMEDRTPDVYGAILTADQQSQERFGGHGSATAQAFGHLILPLANSRDKYTQIYWGIRDFEHRFKRQPEGMWLPETAVDLESLQIMADLGLRFTILAPHQAGSFRGSPEAEWQDLSNSGIDPRRPYTIELAGGKQMALFFYDGPVSRALAFENLLRSGESLAARLLGAFRDDDGDPQLVHIATDGETYGHHKSNGDMALAYALQMLEKDPSVQLTNYGEYLEKFPPQQEARIIERTSWSCIHGVGRWHEDCGCNSGGHPGWNQQWRAPLRQALDELRDRLAPLYESKMKRFVSDPWRARDDYLDIILRRKPDNIDRFLERHSLHELAIADRVSVLKLLEMQRHCLLMFTSCGWFFDELSGIETVQVIQYAGRVLQLAGDLFEEELEGPFLERLAQAKSNLREHGDGRQIFEKWIRPGMITLQVVAAHYAISSLFEEYPEKSELFCFTAEKEAYHNLEAGRSKIATGRVIITSNISQESLDFSFGVLHMGDHNITCGVRVYTGGGRYREMQKALFDPFERADFPEVLNQLSRHFPGSLYSIKSLFRDEQRSILDTILHATIENAISVYRAIYEPNVPLMRFLKDANSLNPRALVAAGEMVINNALQREMEQPEIDQEKIANLLDEAAQARIPLDVASLEFALRTHLENLAKEFRRLPEELAILSRLLSGVELVYRLPFDVHLRKVQDIFCEVAALKRDAMRAKAEAGDKPAGEWRRFFEMLGEKLLVKLR